MDFSAVFRCHKRPNLTELCLRRIVEILDGYSYEFIMMYDGTNEEYIKRMDEYGKFDKIISNPERLKMGDLLNKAFDECTYGPYLFLESDYYWVTPCIEEGKEALGSVDYCRLTLFPYKTNFKEEVEVGLQTLGIYKPGVGYHFSLNPGIRKERFPVGRFDSVGMWTEESNYNKKFKKEGRVAGCLTHNNFIHLGLYNSNKAFIEYFLSYFLGKDIRGYEGNIYNIDIVDIFSKIANRNEYIELFKQYLIESGGEIWLK